MVLSGNSSVTRQKDGRSYTVISDKMIAKLKRKYIVIMDETMSTEVATFHDIPKIGSKHEVYDHLVVKNYDVTEGEGDQKKILTVVVNYEEESSDGSVSTDKGSNQEIAIEYWGWSSSSDEKDLVSDLDGKPVVNSAGDVFDTVPRVSVFAPIFKKVIKSTGRRSGAMSFNCKINKNDITIGDMKCPPRTLFCTVEEERIYGYDKWLYRYTINLKYKSNKVKLDGDNNETEIGWDVAITDAGMREKDSDTGKLKLITAIAGEDLMPKVVTSPELLDGQGHAVSRSASGEPANPFNIHFRAYEEDDFPSWFYTEEGL